MRKLKLQEQQANHRELKSRETGDKPLFSDAAFNFVPGSAFEIGASIALLDHPGQAGVMIDLYSNQIHDILRRVYFSSLGETEITYHETLIQETLKQRFDRKMLNELRPQSDQLGHCLDDSLNSQWEHAGVNWLLSELCICSQTEAYTYANMLTKLFVIRALGSILRDLTASTQGQTVASKLLDQPIDHILERVIPIKTSILTRAFNDKQTRARIEKTPKIEGRAMTEIKEISIQTTDANLLNLGFGKIFHPTAMTGDQHWIEKYIALQKLGRQAMPRVGQDIKNLSRLGLFGESSMPLIPNGFIETGLLAALDAHQMYHGSGLNRWQLTGNYAKQAWDHNMPAAGAQSAGVTSFYIAANCLNPDPLFGQPLALRLGLLISAFMNAGGYHSFVETFPIAQAVFHKTPFETSVSHQQKNLYIDIYQVVQTNQNEHATQLVKTYLREYLKIIHLIKKEKYAYLAARHGLIVRHDIWKVPTLDMYRRIQSQEVTLCYSSSDAVKIDDLRYTILDHHQVVFRDVHELAELLIVTSNTPGSSTRKRFSPIDLVTFRPQRIALHQAIASIITKIQYIPSTSSEAKSLEHDRIFLRIAQHVLKEIQEGVELLSAQLMQFRTDIEHRLFSLIQHEEDHPYMHTLNAWKIDMNCHAVLGKHVKDYTYEKALVALTTDTLYKEEATRVLSAFVEERIDTLCARGDLRALIPPKPTERALFLIAGGHGSGKGSALALLKYSAEKNHIAWPNVSKGGGDIFRTLLLDPHTVHPELYSQLSSPEASYISHTIVKNKLVELAKIGRAPHIFIEQLYLGADKLDLALEHGGSAHAIFVSTEVEVALERSFLRGMNTGRYEHVNGVLSAHLGSTLQLPDRIKEYEGKSVYITIVDNNVNKGEQPSLVASIDCQARKIHILDVDNMYKFIKKTAINIHATDKASCYHPEKLAMLSIEDYLSDLSNYTIHTQRAPSPGSTGYN